MPKQGNDFIMGTIQGLSGYCSMKSPINCYPFLPGTKIPASTLWASRRSEISKRLRKCSDAFPVQDQPFHVSIVLDLPDEQEQWQLAPKFKKVIYFSYSDVLLYPVLKKNTHLRPVKQSRFPHSDTSSEKDSDSPSNKNYNRGTWLLTLRINRGAKRQ